MLRASADKSLLCPKGVFLSDVLELKPAIKFPPVHPLMHLAAKLANRMMKRFLQRDDAATLGRPFFLFRV
ncbi:Neuromedin-S [Manis pentadactyla]|nr:Neuromedin-S [Manis pentadactyla]